MEKFKFLIFTLLLLLVLAACGQGTNNNDAQDPNSEADVTDSDPGDETNTGSDTNEPVEETPLEETPEVLESINLYYVDTDLMGNYRVEIKDTYTKDIEGMKKALELWIAGPVEEGLQSLVPQDVKVQEIEIVDGVAYVSFSNELLNANVGSSGEAFLIEQIVMVVEQFGYDEVFILIDGEIDENFLGHVGLGESFPANDPSDYELYQQ